ncbi:tetratricopeptide repeat protein [Ramlibacter sp. PS3R-8]|uniref:tetratricopeptide repeat protein n=1 Tax=Ramlibacter sp. PS3R-8 TaxID=3133437 RepID=UPI0030B2056D
MTAHQGPALLAGGRFHEALALYAQALRQQPDSLAARIGLARACAGTGDVPAAIAWVADAVRIAPESVEPLQLLADLLLSQQSFAQALPHYRDLLQRFQARSAGNFLHAAFCEENTGDAEAAAALYRQALSVQPDLLEAHVDLAGVLWRLEDFEGSLRHAQRAVAIAPGNAFAQRILGTALLNLNRLDEAERQLRHALALQPGFAVAELDLAFTLLLAGRLPEGWQPYEARWRDGRLRRPAFFQPAREWPGRQVPLAGQRIAVYGEQGWGDVLQCLRFLPQLQALGADVACAVAPELVPLVEASFPGVPCAGPGRDLRVQWHAALMDVPGRLGVTLDTIPDSVPYLRAPQAARERWSVRLQPWAGRRKVGLAWCGSRVQVNNRNRAMPYSLLRPLAQAPGVQCFNLQKGDAGAWTDVAPDARELVDLTGDWTDFGESAAMLEQLDLVVTVDTAIAHLAGALGKPVWILLGPNADWRWLLEREDSPWYPTARLFRRGFGEDRAAQAARVRAAFSEWLASPP